MSDLYVPQSSARAVGHPLTPPCTAPLCPAQSLPLGAGQMLMDDATRWGAGLLVVGLVALLAARRVRGVARQVRSAEWR